MNSRVRSTLFGLATALIAYAGPAAAQQAGMAPAMQQEERVAAVVNDEAISLSDVMGRLRLAMVSSGLPDTAETRQRLLPQVLRLLIDERLQLQEARRLELEVPDQQVDNEIQELARRNNMNMETFRQALDQAGVPMSTMRAQTRANIAWSVLVQRRLRPTASVADEEVNNYLERVQANAGKPEYLASEIFLPVDTPESDGEVRQLAERLVEQIAAGANFAAVAQQFSQSSGAAAGGEMGWIQAGQLESNLDRALQQLKPGQFSRPIRSLGGYHILWLRDQRVVTAGNPDEIKVAIGQLVLPVPAGSDPEVQLQQATQIAQEAQSCVGLQSAANTIPGAQLAGLPLTRMGDIPAEIKTLIQNQGIGVSTQPLVTDVGVMLLMICEREVPEGSLPPPDQVRNALVLEKLDMLQRRYLRDLRRDATIEYRL